MSIVKSFGTVLSDHPSVFRVTSTIKTTYTPDIVVPEVFRGDFVWKEYLSRIINQGTCGNCWAAATTGVLADRFGILTLGQNIYRFSSYQLTICEGIISDKPPFDPNVLSQINLAAHSTRACYGNTILTALKEIYTQGIMGYDCFTNSEKVGQGIKTLKSYTSTEDLPKCESVLGVNYDTCSDGITAARFFRSINYYSVGSNIEDIKKDIFKFGSVVSGFIIFDNFLNNYDGKSVYTGPLPDSKPQGGHAIRIVGWDRQKIDGQTIDYWIIANSWGSSWGRNGYFYMKIGIPECQLEQNVYSLIPDVPGINIINKNIPLHVTPEDIIKRAQIQIDTNTGYKMSAIKKLQEGLLRGSFRELYNPKYMPDFATFVAGGESRVHPLYTDFPISPYFKTKGSASPLDFRLDRSDMPLILSDSEENVTIKGSINLIVLLIFAVSIILTVIILKKINYIT